MSAYAFALATATKKYAEVLGRAVEQGDVTLVSDLFMQLESAIAEESNDGELSNDVEAKAEKLLREVLQARSIAGSGVNDVIADAKSLAREGFKIARRRTRRSLEQVDEVAKESRRRDEEDESAS